MSRIAVHRSAWSLFILAAACYDAPPPPLPPVPVIPPRAVPPPAPPPVMPPPPPPPAMIDARLAARRIDYALALRSASLQLIGALPSASELAAVTGPDAYAAHIDRYLADPRFPARIRAYFRDMMKMGGTRDVYIDGGTITRSLDTAPTFAALLATSDRSMMELFTAREDTCPTLDEATGVFTPGACALGEGLEASGVLTDPGAMSLLYSNMAFRRVRWLQETFACSAFPAELSSNPTTIGGGVYASPWPFESISGGDDPLLAPVDFLNTTSIVCANCHSTLNHIAPLFAYFDYAGIYRSTMQVYTPGTDRFPSVLADWLPPGENFAWRNGRVVSHLAGLGRELARDREVARCQVARAWNWAMSKADVVDQLALVPEETIADLVHDFIAGGHRLKPLLRAIFTHQDFIHIAYAGEAADPSADPHEALEEATLEGPPDVASRLRSCRKLDYAAIGGLLSDLRVDLTESAAGAIYRSSASALGAGDYPARIPEQIEHSAVTATKLFDLFVAAAPEIAANMSALQRCEVGGQPALMFDAGGRCTLEGIACLQGAPARDEQRALCDQIVSLASTREIGEAVAVAAILAAAHTCE